MSDFQHMFEYLCQRSFSAASNHNCVNVACIDVRKSILSPGELVFRKNITIFYI